MNNLFVSLILAHVRITASLPKLSHAQRQFRKVRRPHSVPSFRRWCCLRNYFKDRIEKRQRVKKEVCRALSYPDTLLGENHSFSLRLSAL